MKRLGAWVALAGAVASCADARTETFVPPDVSQGASSPLRDLGAGGGGGAFVIPGADMAPSAPDAAGGALADRGVAGDGPAVAADSGRPGDAGAGDVGRGDAGAGDASKSDAAVSDAESPPPRDDAMGPTADGASPERDAAPLPPDECVPGCAPEERCNPLTLLCESVVARCGFCDVDEDCADAMICYPVALVGYCLPTCAGGAACPETFHCLDDICQPDLFCDVCGGCGGATPVCNPLTAICGECFPGMFCVDGSVCGMDGRCG